MNPQQALPIAVAPHPTGTALDAAPPTAPPSPLHSAPGSSARAGLRYGALGAPLAFAALPLYVLLPDHYASTLGAPLAGLGAVLLGTRALDALSDPWIGRLCDRRLGQSRAQALRLAVLAALLLGMGLVAVYFPLVRGTAALLAWCAAALVVTSAGYSLLSVLHQAWGARLGGTPAQQARIVAWREGLSLAGVLTASVLPALGGIAAMVATALVLLAIGLLALRQAPFALAAAAASAEPAGAAGPVDQPSPRAAWALPWRGAGFRALLGVFLLNGVASAIPATLLLFFVRDRLQAEAWAPGFLATYFLAGALAMPLWLKAVARWRLVPCWLAAMGLATASFVWASQLGPGDALAFGAVCLASGLALGADLAIPGALLAGVVQRAGHGQRLEGLYFGWWNCAGKLNLALAAGLALPALAAFGYRPGSGDATGLLALTLAYAVLPCVLKLCAAAWLWRQRLLLEPA